MAVLIDQEFMSRTVRIRYGNQVGSALFAHIDGIPLILTAAHIVRGMAEGDRLGIRHRENWQMLNVTNVAFGLNEADVCAIRIEEELGQGLREEQIRGEIIYGEEVAYCGFPLQLETYGTPGALGWPVGFVKSAVFSGAIQKEHGFVYYFDTINNVGFSGGPIIKREGGELRVVALVSGYIDDKPTPVFRKLPDGNFEEIPDHVVMPNSGFMIGIPIVRAVETARLLL